MVVMRIIHCSSSSSSSSTRVVDTAWHIRRRRKAGAFCLFYTCTATQETAHSDGGGQWQRETRLRSAAANVQCARVARHAAGKRVCGVRRANVQCARVARHAEPQSVGVVTNNTVHNSSGCAQSCSRAFTDVPRRSARSGIVFVYHRWHICVNPSSYHHSHIFPEENALRLKFAPGKQRCPTLNAVVSCSCPFTTPLAQQTSSLRIPYALCLRVPAVRCAAGACGRALSCVPCTVRTNTPSAVHPVRCLLSGL